MKHLLRAVVTTIALTSSAQAAQLVDYVVAVVNEDVILNSELEQAVESIERQIRASGNTPPTETELREQMRERLIMQTLQAQRAEQRGIRVTDDDLNKALLQIAQQNGMDLRDFARALRAEGVDFLLVREQVRNELLATSLRQREVDARVNVTDREIDAFLAKTRKNDQATEYRLEHILVSVPDGSTDDVKDAARAEAEQIRQAVEDGASFSQMAIGRSDATTALDGGDLGWRTAGALPTVFADEVDDMSVGAVSQVIETGSGFNLIRLADQRGGQAAQMITETRARHILLQPNAIRDETATREQAAELLEELKGGRDFAEVAREYSDDSGSANQGGDLGWQPPGGFVPAFEERLDSLDNDEISEPFETQFGWHIVQLIDRRQRDSAEDIARNQARQAIRQRKVGEEYEDWLRRQRAEAYVELRAEPTITQNDASTATES
ncbi:peptidylprolyl isomerase [Abyssibacter sp.]|uniref:peptidylprolyl isomerase n=1 Tax=Abyssibacter sp. TaxID=2320200 RepID=UPI0025BE9B15|nr:peptidylprolyl isomerase [Abyssibacter sp.]MCK5858978.1 peptidylprolyl isomerase [Abyssibacter sp.]